MRVIAGELRGRNLLSPVGETTRPITDRVKQSVFDILAPRLPDAVIYDCFAGTGSMGIECLSRGARQARFFEEDRSALALLRRNLETLRIADRSQVVIGDLFAWFNKPPAAAASDRADVFFLDPPYRFLRERPDDLRRFAAVVAERHLTLDGIVVFRHDAADTLALPALPPFDVRTYGSMTVELLAVPNASDVPPLD